MARRPPRITSTRRQPTTRGGPRVTGRTQQPTTGRGRIVRQPTLPQVLAPSWGKPPTAGRPGGGGTPAAPAAPAAPTYSISNLPPDASYEQVIPHLQQQRANNLAAVAAERVRGLSDFGFIEGPSGTLTFDPNNPFSKAAVLKKAYDTNRRSTGNSMAAQGQLYSGARQNALDLVSRNQLGAEDSQYKALQAFLAANTGRAEQAQTDYETAAGEAYGDRVGRFQDNPLYDPASGTMPTPAAANATAAAAAAASAKPRTSSQIAAAMRRRRRGGLRIGRI